MCSRPITANGHTFACRTCDQCLSTRRMGWVARSMAELTDHKHALVLTLTYSDATQEGRDGARMFAYADVRAFLARVRTALRREYGDYTLRFICAGEQGSRNDRVHWHMVLFSDHDLRLVGTVDRFGRQITDPEAMMTVGKRKKRLNWSMWGLGFVTFQKADQSAMNYVLSYCMKDQFTAQKSRDTMREAKSENFATGLFRMSKRPPVGENFVMRLMEELDAKGAVLPSLRIKIPDFRGYWHPNGSMRETILWALVALNQRAVWATGRNAPQWAALLASCKDSEKDLEILNGPQKENPWEDESEEYTIATRQRLAAGEAERREFARRCGAQLACTDCLHELTDAQLSRRGVERFEVEGVWHYRSAPGYAPVATRQRQRGGGINPDCQSRSTRIARFVFPNTAPDREGQAHVQNATGQQQGRRR